MVSTPADRRGVTAVAGRVPIWGHRSLMTLFPNRSLSDSDHILQMPGGKEGGTISVIGECKLWRIGKGARIRLMEFHCTDEYTVL